jgi:hypothetical protein
MTSSTPGTAGTRFKLSEDWLATLIGLGIVLVIGAGLIGPGPQSSKLSAEAGATRSVDVVATDGWHVTASLGGESISVSGAASDLDEGTQTVYACADGAITLADDVALPVDLEAPGDDQAQIVLVNGCDAALTLTLKTDPAIRWPVFNLFD